jgi:alkylation response protein AidB-like acyl-CoA dehydrogenase
MMHGTEYQQEMLLPQIRDAEIMWCQGFSEPGSGSDLASLQTRAVRDGDDYVINGQKIWTSYAHRADWIFLLGRTDTDAPKHRGISYFVIKMDTPGITVRPLTNMAGNHHFNEVFFEDVRVPASHLVGEENRGWYVATTTLDFERSGIARVVAATRTLQDLTALAREPGPDGRRPIDNAEVSTRLADLHVSFGVGRLLAYRVAWMQSAGLVPNYEASISKLIGSQLQQRLANMMNMVGLRGQLYPGSEHAVLGGRLPHEYLNAVPLTIAAGTSEIQKNIIATRGLGLPRT